MPPGGPRPSPDATDDPPSPLPPGTGGMQPDPPEVARSAVSSTPRWLVILAWSMGPAALYALLSLAHAALVERILSVDVGFGRSLAFWVGAIYLALAGWGFFPVRPAGWYARRPIIAGLAALGLVGLVTCGAFTGLWLAGHWVPAIGTPVTASAVVVVLVALGVLWLAGREDR
jgi:hypothetical protein